MESGKRFNLLYIKGKKGMGLCPSLVQLLAVYDIISLHLVKTIFFQSRRRVKRKCFHCKMSKITLFLQSLLLASALVSLMFYSQKCKPGQFTPKNTNHPKLDRACKMSLCLNLNPEPGPSSEVLCSTSPNEIAFSPPRFN